MGNGDPSVPPNRVAAIGANPDSLSGCVSILDDWERSHYLQFSQIRQVLYAALDKESSTRLHRRWI
jgi:hypothetical protein